jgi:FKBP-type peptidyl-prolyl cis-trans isomerase FkpA
MNKILLILLFSVFVCLSCKKGYDAVAEVRTQAEIDDKMIQDYIAGTPGLSAVAKQIDSAGIARVFIYCRVSARQR